MPHAHDPSQCLDELARVAVPGGRLAAFHPIGRVALAARHGRVLDDEDVLAPAHIEALLTGSGWRVLSIDDAEGRYLTQAQRVWSSSPV